MDAERRFYSIGEMCDAFGVTARALRFYEDEELIAPDVVWHVPGEHRMAGDLRGREAVITWLTEVRGLGFWLEEHDVFASDQHVCAVSTMGARREGVDVQTRVVHLFRYRQGQQVERWFYPDDPTAWDSIFGR